MDHHQAIATIKAEASHIGQAITRAEAVRLKPDCRRIIMSNNPLNGEIVGYRRIGEYIVELALSDWTGMRGGKYMCGVTVFGHHDLSELVDLDKVADKLRSMTHD